jgi:hypothetical protein
VVYKFWAECLVGDRVVVVLEGVSNFSDEHEDVFGVCLDHLEMVFVSKRPITRI